MFVVHRTSCIKSVTKYSTINRRLHGCSFVGSELTQVKNSSVAFSAFNPRTNTKLEPLFYDATTEEINKAARNAETAFKAYRETPSATVTRFLRAIAGEINKSTASILDRGMQETGYNEARLTGELQRTINQLNLFAKLVDEGSFVDARIVKQEGKPDLRRMLIPIGPVLVFGTSNFPLAFSVAGGDTVSALAAKCPVLVKAHPSHPGTSELVAECIIRAQKNIGVPNYVFSLLHGRETVGETLSRHPAVKAIGFTGSQRGGRHLFDIAASRPTPIPVYAEMGSVNPVIILPGALESRHKGIAETLVQSITQSNGQMCTRPGLIITIGKSNETFLSHAGKCIQAIPPAYLLSSHITEGYRKGLHRFSQTGVSSVAVGMSSSDPHSTCATLFATDADTFLHNASLHEEIFGPAALVVHCTSLDTAQKIVDSISGQLTGTVHATPNELQLPESKALVHTLMNGCGRLIFNGIPTGVEVCSAMNHGGPYPSTTSVGFTSVGTAAINRWIRPICYQNVPHSMLPEELQNENPKHIWRQVNDVMTKDAL